MNAQRRVVAAGAAWLITTVVGLGLGVHTAEPARTGAAAEAVTAVLQSVESHALAGERYETDATQLREVVFADGTALTLGQDAVVIVESYEYTRAQRTGSMVLRVERGVFRVVGGLLNNTSPIVIQTPSARLELDNASAVVVVDRAGGTRAYLLLGRGLTMRSGGTEKTLVRAGFQLVAHHADAPPVGPSRMDAKTLKADVFALNPGLARAAAGSAGDKRRVAVQLAALATEDKPAGTLPTTGTESPPPGNGGPDFDVPGRPDSINDVLEGAEGLGVSDPLAAPNLTGDQATQSTDLTRTATQNRDQGQRVERSGQNQDATRDPGSTTNRLYNSQQTYTQVVTTEQAPQIVPQSGRTENLQYVFFEGGLALDSVGDETSISWLGDDACCSGDITAPFILPRTLPEDGEVEQVFVPVLGDDGDPPQTFQSSIFGNAAYRILQAGFAETPVEELPPGTTRDNMELNRGLDAIVVTRNRDNFLLIEARPAVITVTARDQLLQGIATGDIDATDTDAVLASVRLSKGQLARVGDFDDPTQDPRQTRAGAVTQVLVSADDLEAALDALVSDDLTGITEDQRDLILRNTNDPREGIPDPNRHERFIFATGDVDGRLDPDFSLEKEVSVDRFFLSPGLEGFEERESGSTVASSIRAFLRPETMAGLTLADTGMLMVNPKADAANETDTQIALLHADFGVAGRGAEQRSTISVTIGDLEYQLLTCDTCDVRESVDAVVRGHTIGSLHDNTDRTNDGTDRARASVLFTSPVFSTAAGGGNPDLNKLGAAGYFVLENFHPDDPDSGGLERPLGTSGSEAVEDVRYAYLRLTTATGSSTSGEVQVGQRSALSLQGWAAGLAEFQSDNDIGVTQIDTDVTPDNFTIQTNPNTNRVEAQMTFFNHTSIQLGGLSGNDTKGASAFVDDDLFAARTVEGGNAEVAMIAGNVVQDGLPQSMQEPIRDYKHVKWGYFFGDTVTTPGQREHVHLGSWVAGKVPNPGDLPRTGTATYTGHAIGNVFNNGSLYTAVGSVENRWNFGTRKGTMQMQFDGATLNGPTQLRNNSATFDGRLDATNRVGGVRGNFVQGGSDPAAGVIGRFSIKENSGDPYRASGTFAGEK